MNERYFPIFQKGMPAQLKELSLDEMVLYVRNHLHNFLLDEAVTACFIERFANDPKIMRHEKAQAVLTYLLNKAIQLRPLRPGMLGAIVQLTGSQAVQQRLDFIEKYNESKDIYDQITGLDLKTDGEDVMEFLRQLIESYPNHVAAAQYALFADQTFGIATGAWREAFSCPPELRRDWEVALFNHHAGMCDYETARVYWDKLKVPNLREHSLNLAAEMFVAEGDLEQGLELYRLSLAQDPRQVSVRLRLRELENPFKPDASLLKKRKVEICVYSWNKADILEETLKSLSRTDMGDARINILLNGCTDGSREMVDRVLPLFKDNEVAVHDLHVNIGAPAARNWLMNLPEVRKSDYIAFIDDDIILQKDWLAQFLTVAESDEQIGVVGCKIVDVADPTPYQYLFRYVAMACHGLLKLSIESPQNQFDNHTYDFIRETRSVMGCQHLIRTSAIDSVPANFDIRFSPSQVDDLDHDMGVCLAGYKVMYCGTVCCQHHQGTGFNARRQAEWNPGRFGNTMGNDIKFYFKHYDHMDKLQALDNLSIDLGVEPVDF